MSLFFPYEKEQKTDGISGNKTSQNHHYKTLTIVDNFQRFLASKLSARPLEVVQWMDGNIFVVSW